MTNYMTEHISGASEHDDQCRVFEWAEKMQPRYPELALLFAIPNGAKLPWRKNASGQRYSPEAMRLKKEGLKPGVPDICLPVPVGKYHGLFCELKHGYNKPSPEQRAWIAALTEQGYCVVVAWGWEQVIQFIQDYMERRI